MYNIIRELSEIVAKPTTHEVGSKKVLLSPNETESAVTQIAVTCLEKGEKVEAHIHKTMDEHYFFLEGEAILFLNNEKHVCRYGTYILVYSGAVHSLKALTDIKFITIGIAYDKYTNSFHKF